MDIGVEHVLSGPGGIHTYIYIYIYYRVGFLSGRPSLACTHELAGRAPVA